MVMANPNDQTLTSLRSLCEAGALYVITPIHLCQPGGLHWEKMNAEQRAACEQAVATKQVPPLSSPYHFDRRAVTRIDGPDDKGRVRGFASDGSYTEGYPAGVLKRLAETMLAEKPKV